MPPLNFQAHPIADQGVPRRNDYTGTLSQPQTNPVIEPARGQITSHSHITGLGPVAMEPVKTIPTSSPEILVTSAPVVKPHAIVTTAIGTRSPPAPQPVPEPNSAMTPVTSAPVKPNLPEMKSVPQIIETPKHKPLTASPILSQPSQSVKVHNPGAAVTAKPLQKIQAPLVQITQAPPVQITQAPPEASAGGEAGGEATAGGEAGGEGAPAGEGAASAPKGTPCSSTQACEAGCCYDAKWKLLDSDNYGPGAPLEGTGKQ